ncbi:glycoside hydrolase family 65 protein [Olivibacter sitiensis]|uniref:glycoside hydrolase family 65 protein n=1 Tax=Olivibacter sitiensis TaxID=376470 RepID=UPI0003FC290E|nr:glycoside hydrolase family 65 protein [Olivibacter sitiensis]
MKEYIIKDEWNIIEEGFDPAVNEVSESIFSIGNGRMGQRANFEERYSGKSLQGSYVAGVYYPDKTRVGWWKNGYPEYFAKVINAANWIGIDVWIDGETLDLATVEVSNFKRVLNMREGYLQRSFEATLSHCAKVEVQSTRLCSLVDDEAGAIRYSIKALSGDIHVKMSPYLDGNISNRDSNYDEQFWNLIDKKQGSQSASLLMETKKTAFWVATAMQYAILVDEEIVEVDEVDRDEDKLVGKVLEFPLAKGQQITLLKYAVNLSSENHAKQVLSAKAEETLQKVATKGFDKMKEEQAKAWQEKWAESDIVIEGDVAAQQAIRFNIFQLNQTYTGEDARLNIGPKGFTGEKYGGVTYWDTEAYCVPFYLATAEPHVARNLLIYRYNHLQKAIENAEKLGFRDGAALYPMVTMNGEECHNEWEITFEEIHRNAAIAFAIFNYIRYTGDEHYLVEYGLEVLVAISRFWAQRVNWSGAKGQYVMLGVTGPNEYENNVNNNWYTSYMAMWCLEYTLESLDKVKQLDAGRFDEILDKTSFNLDKEPLRWQHIRDNMYLGEDKELGIFLQQDNYLDKEQILVKDLPVEDRPLNQKWSWDRILRSCYIKQADVLQGIYFLEDRFDLETIKRNYDFYEPRTVHESSLSPCVHAILAAKLGDGERAYQFYLRTARLDLDDYNNDTEDGLHITSMAGTWMSVVEGFAGMRVRNGKLTFHPFITENWKSYAFHVRFRGAKLYVKIAHEQVHISNEGKVAEVMINDMLYTILPGDRVAVNLESV